MRAGALGGRALALRRRRPPGLTCGGARATRCQTAPAEARVAALARATTLAAGCWRGGAHRPDAGGVAAASSPPPAPPREQDARRSRRMATAALQLPAYFSPDRRKERGAKDPGRGADVTTARVVRRTERTWIRRPPHRPPARAAGAASLERAEVAAAAAGARCARRQRAVSHDV
eukprot:scaffold2775_cov343-Prasinococcus_capsulatus_cf.AAC.16